MVVVQPTEEDKEKVITEDKEEVLQWAGHVVHQLRYLFREVIRAGLDKASALPHSTRATEPATLANLVMQIGGDWAVFSAPCWWKNKREKILRGNFFGITRNADRGNRKKPFFPSFFLKMHPC